MGSALGLEEHAIVALRRISRAIDLHSRALSQKHGLTGPQLTTLREIARVGPISAGDLARSVHLSQATITGILSRLERRAFIARNRSEHDRRSVLVSITPEGRNMVEAVPSPLQDRLREEFVKLDDWEQTNMLSALQRIAQMMGA